ncbi:AAA family ATPase [Parabacteroides goldsteinii]|uniref:AAA family ATPase n=1 Tax=Parabacteroides goldsteinii TaxID=328812 RepID=UPI003AB58912
MQRIEIQNFGPIKEASIEIPKFLLLIGEQASGKSTVAKLIYFFRSLKEDFIARMYKYPQKGYTWKSDFEVPTRHKFVLFFGRPLGEQFEITFHYTIFNTLSIKWDKETLIIDMSDSFKKALKGAPKPKYSVHVNNASLHENLLIERSFDDSDFIKLMDESFGTSKQDLLYLVAERSSMVRFGNLFERLFSRELESSLRRLSTTQNQAIEEILLMQFLDRVALLKDYFSTSYPELALNKSDARLKWMINCMYSILKGEYSNQSVERISWGKDIKASIFLRNASSGQQEVIRILQDSIWIVEQNIKAFRVLEEPESHLFPLAQKKLLEFLATMVNASNDNTLVITTHSPYILSSANNLLFASHVASKFPELKEAIQSRVKNISWINPSEFKAYALDQNQKAYCKSIVDERTGMIAQNYLDSVSDELSSEFNQIYKLYISKLKEAK